MSYQIQILVKDGFYVVEHDKLNEEDLILLDIEDYNKQGRSVIFKDKEYEITGNEFNPMGMSRLQLLSKEEDVVTDIVYTQRRPVANLYAKREFLEPFQSSENESERNIGPKQMTLMDMLSKDEVSLGKDEFFQRVETKKTKEELKKEKSYPNEEYMGGIPPINYRIAREDEVLPPSGRLKNNIKAIQVLNLLEEEHRHATKEEQDILSRYVGWGGLSDVFDEEKQGQWQEVRDFLKENLSQPEYDAARESTLTAFYTPKVVIDSIYQALSNMGFESGNIIEPSMGTGRFLGNLPESMRNSKFCGVELDNISGRIAKKLYPNSNIQINGFEKTTFSNNLFDVAVEGEAGTEATSDILFLKKRDRLLKIEEDGMKPAKDEL